MHSLSHRPKLNLLSVDRRVLKMHPFGFAESFLRCAIHGVVVSFIVV
jgi:hypothetical protein